MMSGKPLPKLRDKIIRVTCLPTGRLVLIRVIRKINTTHYEQYNKNLSVKNTLHEQKNLSFAGQDERSRAGFY